MTKAQVTKDSIDLGIVVCNIDNSLAFYKDLLGFELQGTMPMPGGGNMHRLLCGTTITSSRHARIAPMPLELFCRLPMYGIPHRL